VLIKVLIWWEVSILEKSRESFQGAHGVQGAHLDLSTLESQRNRDQGAPGPVPSNATEAENSGYTTLRLIGTRVQGGPCQGAHLDLSTLESQRNRDQGAPGPVPSNATEAEDSGYTTLRLIGTRVQGGPCQGAHFDLSTLESPASFDDARNPRRQIRFLTARFAGAHNRDIPACPARSVRGAST
jgi:hypothetical protein